MFNKHSELKNMKDLSYLFTTLFSLKKLSLWVKVKVKVNPLSTGDVSRPRDPSQVSCTASRFFTD